MAEAWRKRPVSMAEMTDGGEDRLPQSCKNVNKSDELGSQPQQLCSDVTLCSTPRSPAATQASPTAAGLSALGSRGHPKLTEHGAMSNYSSTLPRLVTEAYKIQIQQKASHRTDSKETAKSKSI